MPRWSATSTPASGDLRSPLSPSVVHPRWLKDEGESRRSSPNKLAVWLDVLIWLWILSDLEIFLPLLLFPGRRGGEREAAGRDESYLHQASHAVRPWSISSGAHVKKQWRPPDPGCWLPAFVASPLTLLVEWQPQAYSSRPMSQKGGSSKQARWPYLLPLVDRWRWRELQRAPRPKWPGPRWRWVSLAEAS